MNKMKQLLSRSLLFFRKASLRSYPTLIAMLLLGIILISAVFETFHEFKANQLKNLEQQRMTLQSFLYQYKDQHDRLKEPVEPTSAESMAYAKKVPLEREVPRFLLDLHALSQKLKINISKLEVQEEQIKQQDLITLYLKGLDTSTKNSEKGQTKKTSDKGNAKPPQSQHDPTIPLKMIRFHIEYKGDFDQLKKFLGGLETTSRLVHIENWSYTFEKPKDTIKPGEVNGPEQPSDQKGILQREVSADFEIFYYMDKLKGIPALPPLDIKGVKRGLITVVPKPVPEEKAAGTAPIETSTLPSVIEKPAPLRAPQANAASSTSVK